MRSLSLALNFNGIPESVSARKRFLLQINNSGFVTLPADGSLLTIDGKSVYSNQSVSTRGTVMHILQIARSNSATYSAENEALSVRRHTHWAAVSMPHESDKTFGGVRIGITLARITNSSSRLRFGNYHTEFPFCFSIYSH